jgi:formamidopyrimidine-DNA glycosylase
VPELPEVEVVRAGLASAVTGATILGVEVFEPRSLKRHDPVAGAFETLLTGRVMEEPARRGKFLWIPLQGAPRRAIVAHLGMSGQILLRIKRVLLDQTVLSGVGNIYADEALWAARIHYEQPASSLSRAKVRTLLAEVRHVLEKALAEGGTSFDAQYVNVNGNSGYFAHSLNAYGQEGKPCPRCGTPIVRERFMNRSSHFCPHCQKLR